MIYERKDGTEMDLEIKYDRGTMVVHLDKFLEDKGIRKFRKLVKLIAQSHNPSDLDVLRDFVEKKLEESEAYMKMNQWRMCEAFVKRLDRDIVFYRKCLTAIAKIGGTPVEDKLSEPYKGESG